MPATPPGDGMPRDEGKRRLSKPPAHVPTIVSRDGVLGPRVLLMLLALLLATAAAGGLLGQGQPTPTPDAGLVEASPTTAVASPPVQGTDETPLPAETGPVGAPLPATPPPPPKETRPTSVEPEQLTGYEWPLRGARITSRFGSRDFGGFVLIDGEEVHDGLDLARFCGFKVRAAHDGVVLYAGRKFDDYIGYRGSAADIYSRLERQGRMHTLPIVVVIDDGNGYRSMYVHLSQADVKAGDIVKAGDVIGREGATGFATGCHLHYTLIRMDGPWQTIVPRLHQYGYPSLVRERVDPLRVLPWDDPHAPERLRERVATPAPSPFASPPIDPSASPGGSPDVPAASPGTPVGPSPSAAP